jgi:hypothetical protein
MSKAINTKTVERDDVRGIAWLALGMFVGGLVLPFVAYPVLLRLAAVSHQVAIRSSAWLGLVCELLALVLGVAGWRRLPGKVGGIGSGVLLGLVLIAVACFLYR